MSLKHFYVQLVQALNTFLITVIIVFSLQFSYVFYVNHFIETQAHQWLDRTLLDLLSSWDEQKFHSYSSAELLKNFTEQQRNDTQQMFERLDELLQYEGSKVQSIQYSILQNTQIRYQAGAQFKHGLFLATITVAKESGAWKIKQFYYEYGFYPLQKQRGSLQLL